MDICLSYNIAHSKKNKKTKTKTKKKRLNEIQENKEGQPRKKKKKKKKKQYKVSFVLIYLKSKQTNDSPFRLLSSFPVKSCSPCIIACI